ncbi:MAG: translation initiation factor IF-2 subunit alpha [Candidatus Thermoplasmatota archaeon]|jgi:translation initiation factor 2 subunit 1|nr:translation initiation factor IF-2 subunit alpha [Candidatus Thermoplasmatota archaeon]MCL5785573.1 translation initiation factor IF-2 subunit alpha [Candidatus Thermoplasmatota archaeon]
MGKDIPQVGDLVVVTVTNVKNFGAICKLEEYPEVEGFIHIAEVATGWVKHIRDHIREGQRTVCKVIGINNERGNVDLSLKKVNAHQKRERITEWKGEQKAEKLLEIVGKALKKPVDDCWKEFANDLVEKYGTLYAAFEDASSENEWLPEVKGKWKNAFVKVAKENVTSPMVSISGNMDIYCLASDGIDRIRSVLATGDAEGVTIRYGGSPRYRMTAIGPDFKMTEELLKTSVQKILDASKKNSVVAEFTRD